MNHIAELRTGAPVPKTEELQRFESQISAKLDDRQELVLLYNELITKLKSEIDSKIQEIQSLKTTITAKDGHVLSINKQIDTLQAKHKSDIAAISNNKRQALSDLENSRHTIENLKNDFGNKETDWTDKKKELDERIILHKKEIGLLNNRIGVLSKKLLETEESNRQVLLKTIEANKKYQNLSTELAQTKQILTAKDIQYKQTIENLKKEYSGKTKQMITDNTKRVVTLMAQTEGLRKALKRKDNVLDEKEKKERELLTEFVSKFKDISAMKPDAVARLSAVASGNADKLPHEKMFKTETIEPEPEPFADIFKEIGVAEIENEEIEVEMPPPEMNLLEPMIECALEQGDTEDNIVDSLVSSGYERVDVLAAMKKLK
ncbi:hypothetical protein ACFL96_19000 [Thermoproteota archaeon]